MTRMTHGRESWPQIRGNPQHEFARKSPPHQANPAKPGAAISAIHLTAQLLRDISRRTNSLMGGGGRLFSYLEHGESREEECRFLFELRAAYVRQRVQHALDVIARDFI
jgi:hypothetical protein